MIGRTVGHYTILEKLGEGGMGVVYRARDLRLDRLVALKALPPDRVSDPERRRRFVAEARAASALNHPNIVTIYDIGEQDDLHYIAMEFVAGKTLGQLIGRKGLPLTEALNIAVQITEALGRAHTAGIVHRDLKPSNIIVTGDGLVKILDFGLAKLMEPDDRSGDQPTRTVESSPVTEAGRIVGTVAYMSPEQAEGKGVDGRSDIFAFGSVLYEMLTGQNPYAGGSTASTLAAILTRDPVPPSQVVSGLPPEVERLVLRCLRREPERRPQTMSDLKVLLKELKEDSESGMLSGSRAITPRRRARTRLLIPLAALVLVAAAAGTAWVLLRPAPEAPVPELERLTFELGLATMPTLSADGKLLAYASDLAGQFDIYVRQTGSPQAIRRTAHEADDDFPAFSPDGTQIVFRSERDGGGLYIMDALVGDARKIADAGRLPSFSPDGSTIVYLVGAPLVGRAKMFLVSTSGGTPRPFRPDFQAAGTSPPQFARVVWSPDGKYVLVNGKPDRADGAIAWYLAPVDGGEALRLEAPPRGAVATRSIAAWQGKHIYYAEGSTTTGVGLYRVALAEDPWRVAGSPERLTLPTGLVFGAAVSTDQRIVFGIVEPAVNIWSVALDVGRGVASGPLRAVTADSVVKLGFSVAANGSRLAYSTSTREGMRVRVRELATGREEEVAERGAQGPRLSGDGQRLAYGARGARGLDAYVLRAGATAAQKLCERCLVQAFFRSPAEVLLDTGDALSRLNMESETAHNVLETPGKELIDIALSPDERWLAFTMPRPDLTAGLYLVPVGQRSVPETEWNQVAEDDRYLGAPAWSPDGRLLYYASNRDGFGCIWAQAIAGDGKPSGAPFAVYHNHRPSPGTGMLGGATIGVTPDTLYLLLADVKGSLWSIKPPR